MTYVVKGTDGRPAGRKAKLSELLEPVREQSLGVTLVEVKHADPRELVLKAAAQLRAHLELMAALMGKLQTGVTVNLLVTPEYRRLQGLLLEALEPFPEARQRVAGVLYTVDRAN